MFFCGCRTVVRCLWSRQFEYNETAEKPPTGRFFWTVHIVCLSRGLFSYKSPLFFNPIFGLKNSPAKAPDDKGCRTLRSATKDAVFGICELFSKSSTKNFSFALSKLFCFNCPSLRRRRIALVLSQKVQPD